MDSDLLKKEQGYETHRYWQNQAITQLSAVNNWLLVTAVGFLSFSIGYIDIPALKCCSINDMDCGLTLYVFSIVLLLLSIISGSTALFTRLCDFRKTRKITLLKMCEQNETDSFKNVIRRLRKCTKKLGKATWRMLYFQVSFLIIAIICFVISVLGYGL